MSYKPAAHPLIPPPTLRDVEAYAAANGVDGAQAWVLLNRQRDSIIAREEENPLLYGWEPQIWKVADALLGFPWVDEDWADRMRRKLGFERAVNVLLINGGQRGGKSEYASKRITKLLVQYDRSRGWALHSKEQMSVDYQQPLIWKYLPPEWRKKIQTAVAYVAYKQKTGFSDGSLVLPNASDLRFFNYTMDRKTVEGGNLDIIWPDELVPPDWVETMELRIAEKEGKMIITFTPVQGFTPTVGMFQQAAEVKWWSVGWLLPKDGGKPDAARALGLTEDEYRELGDAQADKRPAECPNCRPENVDLWLTGEMDDVQAAATFKVYTDKRGRQFELIPRVMKPSSIADPKGMRAVLFFHSADNPYGNPRSVINTISGKNPDFVKERFYGLATKLISSRFTKFDSKVHGIRAEDVPKDLTRYCIFDPAGGRNMFILWCGVDKDGKKYVYREWPGNYPIPEVGVPGPWAVVGDGEKNIDGKRGPGQRSFGFGYWRYKREFARLEGWANYAQGCPDGKQERDWIIGLEEDGPAREKIHERIVDARFASQRKNDMDRPSTLITDFEEVGITLTPAPAKSLEDMMQAITDALDYDTSKPVSFLENSPGLYIVDDAVNLNFALATWTGASGSNGATKDPIDVLGYWLMSDPVYVGNEAYWNTSGGGSY